MPKYTYQGDPDRYYPSLGVTPKEGQEFEFTTNPDNARFHPPDPEPESEDTPAVKPPKKAAQPTPGTPATPKE